MERFNQFESRVFDLISRSSDQVYLYMADLDQDFSRWSKSAVEYFGLPSEYIENTAQVWSELIHPEDRHIFLDDMARLFRKVTERHDCKYRIRNRDGQYVWVHCTGSVERMEEGSSIFVGAITNLGASARFDPVTGLAAGADFIQQINKVAESGSKGAVLLFGLDHFKRVNDLYGFTVGDEILRYLATQARKLRRGNFFRMGGDSIACILLDCTDEDIDRMFHQMQSILAALPPINGEKIAITMSCGCVRFPEDGVTSGALMAGAEYGLDMAKKEHRGSMRHYSRSLHQTAVRIYQVEEALRDSVANGFRGFELNYHPLVREEDGSLYGAEALLRFSTPSLFPVSPSDFIPLLERDGTINEVGAWVLRTALTQCARWRRIIPDFCVSVNVSYLQFRSPGFRSMVLSALEECGVPPEGLTLELTESCRITSASQLQQDIDFFTKHNIHVALDDFGTGYATVSVLRSLTPTWIKIDHSFVASITESELDRAIIEYILQLSAKANIKVCVEGIENQDILHIVRQYHPQLLQGYYFSKPLNAADFEAAYIGQSDGTPAPQPFWLRETADEHPTHA